MARVFFPSVLVYIDGTLVDDKRLEVHTNHGLELPIATATVVLSIPRPAAAVFNKEIEIHAQIAENPSRIFHGMIRADSDSLDESGFTATLNCQGWGHVLAMPATEDRAWDGPIDARQVIRSVLHTYGFGNADAGGHVFHCPIIVNYDGTEVILGGNAEVDGGQVRWEKGESGLDFILRICNLFGYYACDTPDGVFYIIRAIGTPPEPPDHVWDEGDDLVTGVRSRDAGPVYNWIEVTGATPTPADGTTGVPYRSFPAMVLSNPLIPIPYAKFLGINDDLLISDDLCQSVRNIAEVRFNSDDPATMYEWTDIGHPRFRQGRSMGFVSPTLDIDVTVWLYSMAQDITADGYWETFTGRADLGETLPEGEDLCVDEPLIEGPIHLGTATLGYYEVNAPDDVTAFGDFTPSDAATSLTLTLEAHSVNNHLLGGGTGTPSTWSIEQPVGTELASGPLPPMPENFGEVPTWDSLSIPVPAVLEADTGVRVIITSNDNDDFEIRNAVLTICWEGEPVLPTEPVDPPVPPPTPSPAEGVCVLSPPDVTVPPNRAYGSMVIPAGTEWVWIHGNVVDATGDESGISTYAAQGYGFLGAGLKRYMLVPGTATEADPDAAYRDFGAVTGTIKVGSGPFETFWRVGSPAVDTTVSAVSLRSEGDTFSVSDVCFEFLTSADWPY